MKQKHPTYIIILIVLKNLLYLILKAIWATLKWMKYSYIDFNKQG